VTVVGVIGLLGFVCAVVNAAKEKFGMALLSIVIPVIGIVGALRLARPTSLWARAFYSQAKIDRAGERFAHKAASSLSRRKGGPGKDIVSRSPGNDSVDR